jgi:hypothetical protein
MTTRADDIKLLTELLQWAEVHDEAEERFNVKAFENMLQRVSASGRELTPSQRSWVRDIHEKVFDEPRCENLFSSGKVPRGREVDTPEVLRNLPLKPPGRR